MFGKVLDIVVTEYDCLFIMEPFIVITFKKHYNAYEVEQLHFICRHRDFADHHILTISKCYRHDFHNKKFVCFKYDVITK